MRHKEWHCSKCERKVDDGFETEFSLTCPDCGGGLELIFLNQLTWEKLSTERDGVSRFEQLLPVSQENLDKVTSQIIPEFKIPVEAPALKELLGVESLHLVAPIFGLSGTFKDTEAAVMIAKCLDWGLFDRQLSWHSTGNTARAYREYAIKAGLKSRSYFPLYCLNKFKGVEKDPENLLVAYDGPFQEISAIAKVQAKEKGSLHLAPLGWKIEGKATLAYHIFERLPGTNVIVQTIAGGYGALGLELGIGRMRQAGLVSKDIAPRYELFQIDGADTIARLMPLNRDIEETDLKLPVNPFEPTLQSTNPLSTFKEVRRVVTQTKSSIRSVTEQEVVEGHDIFEKTCVELGIPISYEDEKSPFISWAGLVKQSREGKLKPTDRIAFVVTGSRKRTGNIPEPDLVLQK